MGDKSFELTVREPASEGMGILFRKRGRFSSYRRALSLLVCLEQANPDFYRGTVCNVYETKCPKDFKGV